ncbi:unnamed protein product, partial [Mesorhabditis spiculigera]
MVNDENREKRGYSQQAPETNKEKDEVDEMSAPTRATSESEKQGSSNPLQQAIPVPVFIGDQTARVITNDDGTMVKESLDEHAKPYNDVHELRHDLNLLGRKYTIDELQLAALKWSGTPLPDFWYKEFRSKRGLTSTLLSILLREGKALFRYPTGILWRNLEGDQTQAVQPAVGDGLPAEEFSPSDEDNSPKSFVEHDESHTIEIVAAGGGNEPNQQALMCGHCHWSIGPDEIWKKRHKEKNNKKKMDFSELLQQAEKNKEKLEKKVSTIKSTIDKEDRIQREKEAKKEKERLAELRLQANGGKANKKIARHFGIDPVNMQIRYGNSHEHIETLQKRRSKEQEEQDMLADSLRGGVHKALQLKQKAEQLRGKLPADEHRRAGTSKENSLAGMSSRHRHSRDHFSPPRDSKGQPNKFELNSKRPPPPAALDFSKSAEGHSSGRDRDRAPLPPSREKIERHRERMDIDRERINNERRAPPSAPVPQKEKRKPFTKGPTPPPIIPPAVPGKKYLPGDDRYQPPAPGERRKDGEKGNGSGSMRREKTSSSSSSSSKGAPRQSASSSAPRAPHHQSNRPPMKTMGELFSNGAAGLPITVAEICARRRHR